MKPLLEFDDAGAADDEPVKGVTVGDIRAWHDQYDNMLTTWAECRELLSKERTACSHYRAALEEILATNGDGGDCRGIAACALPVEGASAFTPAK